MLIFRVTKYNDIEIDPISLPDTGQKLIGEIEKLISTDGELSSDIVQLIWLRIPAIQCGALMPACLQYGFVLHHAQHPFVMLVKNINHGRRSPIDGAPPYPSYSTRLRVIVFNHLRTHVLMVQEKPLTHLHHNHHHHHRRQHRIHYRQQQQQRPGDNDSAEAPPTSASQTTLTSTRWKFVTGASELREFPHETAAREVYEETGIEIEVLGIIELETNKRARFDCQEHWITCVAHIAPGTSETIQMCQYELLDAAWFRIGDARSNTTLTDINKYLLERALNFAHQHHRNAPSSFSPATTVRPGKKNKNTHVYPIIGPVYCPQHQHHHALPSPPPPSTNTTARGHPGTFSAGRQNHHCLAAAMPPRGVDLDDDDADAAVAKKE